MSTVIAHDNNKNIAVAKSPRCPNCSSPYIKRERRTTIFQRLISLIYVYPFTCQLCTHRFKLFQPGVRYFRVDEDQREYQRIGVDLPVELLALDDACSIGSAIEISMRGCTVRTHDLLALASIMRVRMQIPHENIPLTIEAAIVRNASQDRIGLEFLRFRGDERQRLRQFVQHQLARHNS